MTMTQFAERLQGLAPGFLRVPVLDATKIEGAFDFSLNFSPIGAFQPAAGDGPSGGAPAAPTGAVTLFEALQRQLGLKLEQEKRPNPVLVIDYAERPTAN
jgi:uncharacterized protein (TIGR03435 family)